MRCTSMRVFPPLVSALVPPTGISLPFTCLIQSPRRMPAWRKTWAAWLLRRLMSAKVNCASWPSLLHQTSAFCWGARRAMASTTS